VTRFVCDQTAVSALVTLLTRPAVKLLTAHGAGDGTGGEG